MRLLDGHFAFAVLCAVGIGLWLWRYYQQKSARARSLMISGSLVGLLIGLSVYWLLDSMLLQSWLWTLPIGQGLEVGIFSATFWGFAASLSTTWQEIYYPQKVSFQAWRVLLSALFFLAAYYICRWLHILPEYGWSAALLFMSIAFSLNSSRQALVLLVKGLVLGLLILGIGVLSGYIFTGLAKPLMLGNLTSSTITLPIIVLLSVAGAAAPIITRYWLDQPAANDSQKSSKVA